MNQQRWQLVNELFHQALELPPEERDGFLREACGKDDKLRQAVQSLLAADAEATGFMERPPELAP